MRDRLAEIADRHRLGETNGTAEAATDVDGDPQRGRDAENERDADHAHQQDLSTGAIRPRLFGTRRHQSLDIMHIVGERVRGLPDRFATLRHRGNRALRAIGLAHLECLFLRGVEHRILRGELIQQLASVLGRAGVDLILDLVHRPAQRRVFGREAIEFRIRRGQQRVLLRPDLEQQRRLQLHGFSMRPAAATMLSVVAIVSDSFV